MFLKNKNIDTVQSECGEIVKYSEISISIYEIYIFWNEYDIEKVPK